MSDNWVVSVLENALSGWNDKLAEIWTLLTQTPETFKGGDIWNVIVGINSALTGIGYGLLVLFFAIGIFQSAASFRDFQRPEFALRHFIRFIIAKVAVGSCMELMAAVFSICGGIINTAMGSMGGAVSTAAELPAEIVEAIESLGLLASIPLWLVSLLAACSLQSCPSFCCSLSTAAFSGCTSTPPWPLSRWPLLPGRGLPPVVRHF